MRRRHTPASRALTVQTAPDVTGAAPHLLTRLKRVEEEKGEGGVQSYTAAAGQSLSPAVVVTRLSHVVRIKRIRAFPPTH